MHKFYSEIYFPFFFPMLPSIYSSFFKFEILSIQICINEPSVFVVVVYMYNIVDGVEPYNSFVQSLRLIDIRVLETLGVISLG